MQKIPLMAAKVGMVLARDVFRTESANGIPICGKDTELTDSLIARLENLNIQSVYVEGHPVWSEGDRTLEETLRDLDTRFEKVRQDPLMAKVYDIYAEYLKRSMGESGGRKAE
ncbi:hypothetical protein FO488_06740 [Geobacter sp. FeAm09]|uniref:hypothetical protein n=1 Tax=Geobacter sp. FeAm09 TaxID=2597769 RepID=UPI0011EE98B9|nr:hypothetical protein [Geobacter sp. FeAm09]QEM67881.1 hypothetical protein FO488_06740 [Geobacter sp. FeAm09]